MLVLYYVTQEKYKHYATKPYTAMSITLQNLRLAAHPLGRCHHCHQATH